MTRLALTLVVLVASAAPALAQSKALAESLARMHAAVAVNVVEAAEKMPDAAFAFQPAKDVRTFGGFVGHVANASYSYCSRAKGEANPNKEDFEKPLGKAALVAAIKGATAYCDAVYKTQTDASLSELVTLGQNHQPRGEILIQNLSHSNE
ncbi:MAG: DinB family protein, partial [Acidobacteriota bacterium]